MKCSMRRATVVAAMTTLAALPTALLAHGTEGQAKVSRNVISKDVHAFGVEGDPRKAKRTITIAMDDSMRYSQSRLQVAQGETVTFIVNNKGKLLHELVIGTAEELQKHAELMRKNPGMEHEEPYMLHVKPGTTGTMTWQFTRAGTFQFGCMVAGHFEAGMKGAIVVAASE